MPEEHAGSRKCVCCGRLVPVADLNVEAVIHHGAKGLQCKDRQACERARRKAGRR